MPHTLFVSKCCLAATEKTAACGGTLLLDPSFLKKLVASGPKEMSSQRNRKGQTGI